MSIWRKLLGEPDPPSDHFDGQYWRDKAHRHGGVHKAVVGAIWPLAPHLIVWGNSGYPITSMIQPWRDWTQRIAEAVGIEPEFVEFRRKTNGVNADYSYLHVFEGAEALDWRIGLRTSIGDSPCPRCDTGGTIVDRHCTMFSRSGGQSVLCDECWSDLTPERRLPYYQVVVDRGRFTAMTWQDPAWGDHYGEDGHLLLDACLAGL